MSLFGKVFETVGNSIQNAKEQKAQDEAFVRENEGTRAICEYFVQLFEKGYNGYDWLKQNRKPVYPVVNGNSVSLCYYQPGNGQSLSEVKGKDVVIWNYTFQELYQWYGLSGQSGYSQLTTRTQRRTLEGMIAAEVSNLPHIKYNGGFLVKMFA